MELIGGVMIDGALRRDAALRPLTGEIEMTLAELGGSHLSQPERVTRFLAAALEQVGSRPCGSETAAVLSVGDRQHLMRLIGAAMDQDLVWLTTVCTACGEGIDIPIRQSQLPVKPAGPGYPARRIRLRGAVATIRAATGEDQAAIAGLPEDAAVTVLLERLVEGASVSDLTEEETEELESALEEMAPEVAMEAVAACPECMAESRVNIDPYLTLTLASDEIYDDINILARRYHWSEAEILRLPRDRRKHYLRMIDADRGMIAQQAPV